MLYKCKRCDSVTEIKLSNGAEVGFAVCASCGVGAYHLVEQEHKMITEIFEVVECEDSFLIKPLKPNIYMPDWAKETYPTLEGALEHAKVLERKIKDDTTGFYKRIE